MLGYEAYKKGQELFLANDLIGALASFDIAIEYGFGSRPRDDGDVFALRGSCLQSQGFDLDAIDDFDIAIQLRQEYAKVSREGEDCNLYYQRANSKSAAGDYEGSITDIKEAIKVASSESKLNAAYDKSMQKIGWPNAAEWFQSRLTMERMAHESKELLSSTNKQLYEAGAETFDEFLKYELTLKKNDKSRPKD